MDVDAHDLVVGTRSQVFAVRRKANSVYGARMMTHGSKLLGSIVSWIVRIVNSFCRPNSDMPICGCSRQKAMHNSKTGDAHTSGRRDQSGSVRRDMTAIDFEVFLLSTMR